ncbi:RNA polymerase sigma factor [Arthrobacter burdickii]|uniref:RNA polymerase sigma factor n=1 Tax=Arthrobacter burdickii TaxID=3035920 RepID=A0ABT8JYE3_9MICC|nr:RNA polymerase sigma factor [Arthrobacter burdickii]MDN4609601.1 RNA polymerase sigma factor [Arthrobacter burdickii]
MGGTSGSDDEALWRQVVTGDGNAFTLIFDRHRDAVFRHAGRQFQLSHVAEDITAMVFYEAWRKRLFVRIVDGSVLPWLLVTTNYVARNQARHERRHRNLLAHLPAPEQVDDIADTYADEDASRQRAGQVRQALAKLRPLDRDVLTLCVLEEMTTRQAAIVLDVPEGTIKSRLSRAKTRLGVLLPAMSPFTGRAATEGNL